ncbi:MULTISPECIES: hypothetical protein [Nostocales]|jgi:toxin ParE1/3/4|nr:MULTISPECIES: hypothetical protein [Nostocales]MCX5984302.1 hypothetical protein [Nostocales cyanobacterium LacPavin_0920_SED1_MAG_38_18]
MAYLLRTTKAEEDLIQIWLYIATDNQVVADRIIDLYNITENP